MNDWTLLGYFLLAIAAGLVVYGMASLLAALRINAPDWLFAVGGTDEEDDDDDPLYPRMPPIPADGDDYTYTERPEMLLSAYDVRTYPQRTDERIAALEDEIRQLELRIRALEGR